MRRNLILAALLVSTAAYAHQSTWLEEMRYSMYKMWGVTATIPVPYHMDNIKAEDIGALDRWYPDPGEEGQFSAVRFTPSLDFSVREISFTAPNSTKFGVTCSVADDRIVNLYVSSAMVPPNNAVPDVSVIVPGQPGAVDTQVLFDIMLEKPLKVPAGESLFVAIEHPGLYPSIGCLTISTAEAERDESEFWSYATDVPFSWKGWEELGGYTFKPLVSVSGYVAL